MSESTFTKKATAAGFSAGEAAFMYEFMAQTGHHHDVDEIDGLNEEALEDAGFLSDDDGDDGPIEDDEDNED